MLSRLRNVVSALLVALLAMGTPASGQGVGVDVTVRVTRTDGTTYDARVTEVRPGASFEVFGRDGRPFNVALAEVRRFEATGRREPIKPIWTAELRPYDLYLLERVDGTVVEIAVAGWGMFRLERDGVAMGDYRTAFRAFEVLSGTDGPSEARGSFGFEAAVPAKATADGFRTLEVTVLTAGTGAPAAGVLVRVSDGDRSYADLTDRNGSVRFVVPSAGEWTVLARDTGGRTVSSDVALTPADSLEPSRMVVFLPLR
ncbi:MAG: hypothetical protein Q8L86_07720 [Vicinamibacterales bacterium]|nr:hypothetical protein [Vicinamibacterales bacterium]